MLEGYQFNPHAVPVFLAAFVTLGLGVSMRIKRADLPLSIHFFGFCAGVFVWLFCTGIAYLSTDQATALRWFHWDNAGVMFISPSFFGFSAHLTDSKFKKLIPFGYALATIFAILSILGYFPAVGVYEYKWGFFPHWSIPRSIPFFLFFFGFMMGAFLVLKAGVKATLIASTKNQIRYALAAFVVAYFGSVDYLATFGFAVYPFGFIPMFLFGCILFYAIIKHRLMDIDLLAREALGRGGAMGALILPFIVLGVYQHGSVTTPLLLITAVVVTRFFYQKTYQAVQDWVDEFLFKGRYSAKRTLRQVAQQSFRLSNLSDLVNQSVKNIAQSFDLNRAALYFHNMTVNKFTSVAHFPNSDEPLPEFSEGDALVKSLDSHDVVTLKTGSVLSQYGTVLPLCADNNVFGFLAFGHKDTSGGSLSNEEIDDIRQLHEHALWYAHAFYEQSMMVDKMTHDNIRYAGNIRRFVFAYNMSYSKGLDNDQKELLSHIDQQASMLEEYLNDLREIMSILARRMQGKYKMEIYDLAEVIREILPAERARAQIQEVAFSCNLDANAKERYLGWGERSSIKHVIENLLSNAFKFTPKGRAVRLDIKDLGIQLQITISDTGIGIPPESVSHIFDLFYQGAGREDMDKSTGIGLSIVREIVALHKGNIDVISEPGEGTSFFIQLPSARNQKVEAA